MKKDFELSESEKSQKIKELEKLQRQWKQEKDELHRVIALFCYSFPFFCYNEIVLSRIWPTRKKSCGFNRKS